MAKAAASAPEAAGTAAGSGLDPLDLYGVRTALSEEERLVQDSVARLVDAEVLPIIQRCFEEHRFPKELIPQLAAQGLLGSSIQGYDCAGLNAVCYGLICQELERGATGGAGGLGAGSGGFGHGRFSCRKRRLPRRGRA